jgi:hypothetical protein
MVRRFLLGIASEEEACQVEDAILAGELDASFLRHSEDELIDEFCAGTLNTEERRGYIENFLISGERRQRHAFGAALVEYLQKQTVTESRADGQFLRVGGFVLIPSWKQTALIAAAACVLFASLATFEYWQVRRETHLVAGTKDKLAQLQTSLISGPDTISQLKVHSQASLPGEQASVEQMPIIDFSSSTRDVHPILLRVPVQAQFVRMQVSLPSWDSSKYRELVLAEDGRQLWAQEFIGSSVPASSRAESIVSASVLSPGVYHFKLVEASSEDKFQELIDQVFRVER